MMSAATVAPTTGTASSERNGRNSSFPPSFGDDGGSSQNVAAAANSGILSLSEASDIPFLATKLQGCKAYHCVHTLPRDLSSLESPQWQNGTYLKEIFTIPSPSQANPSKTRKVQNNILRCLLAAAKMLEDRLVVVNAWLNQPLSEQQRWVKELKRFYLCPSRFSDETFQAPGNIFPTVFDNEKIHEESFESSASSQVLKPPATRRKRAARPTTSHQLYNAENQSKENKLIKSVQSMIETTSKEDGASFDGKYDVLLLVKRTVRSPRGSGRHPMLELILSQPRCNIVARNDASAVSLLGQAQFDALVAQGANRVYPGLDHPAEENDCTIAVRTVYSRAHAPNYTNVTPDWRGSSN